VQYFIQNMASVKGVISMEWKPQSTRPERTDTEPMVVWTAVRTLLKMGLWARNL